MDKKIKIGVCSLSIGEKYKEYTKYSLINKIKYCRKHGYDFIEDETIYNPEKPIPWSKLLLILKYLSEYDYLIWIDADILIMNSEIKLEDFIEKYNSVDIICGSDWKMINTGVIFVKNTDFSREFIRQVYDNKYDPEEDKNQRYLNWEQGSFINLYDLNSLDCRNHIKVTDPSEFNSYWYNYFPGHFILHFAGVRGDLLSYLIKDYCPDRLDDIDDDKSYNDRMLWLSGPVRDHLDNKLKNEKEKERRICSETANSLINYITKEEYISHIEKYEEIFSKLLDIVKSTGEQMEGNCFYKHLSFERIDELNKEINLFSIGRKGKNIIEIGFNAGHSCLLFLISNPENKIDCFDICEHSYTELCFEYLSECFPGRLTLHKGNSVSMLPLFRKENPYKVYDIVHIDGSHELNDANCDFFNTLSMTKKESILIFGDVYIPQMKYLWDGYVRDGHIQEIYSLPVGTYQDSIGVYL